MTISNYKEKRIKNMKRFEEVVKAYLTAPKEAQEIALSMMSDEERKTFLEAVGFYKLFNDSNYYNAVEKALCEIVWQEMQKKQP